MASDLEIAQDAYDAEMIRSAFVNGVLETGRRLKEKQEQKRYINGGFQKWVDEHLKWGMAHVYRFIEIHDAFDGKSIPHVVHNFSMRALSVLAKAEEPVREKVLEKVKNKKLTEKQVKELIADAEGKAARAIDRAGLAEAETSSIRIRSEEKLKEKDERVQELEWHIMDLVRERDNLKKNKDVPNFKSRLSAMNSSIAELIQSDVLVKMLIELESVKNILEYDEDIAGLELLVIELNRLAERAAQWSKRVTPTSDKWQYLQQQRKGN